MGDVALQVPVLSGIRADQSGDWRQSYPRNLIPVPRDSGISKGYLRPADGIAAFGTGPGTDRGGIYWRGVLYRVMGTKFCAVLSDGAVQVLADVGAGGTVTLDYGTDRLALAAGGRLYYWNGGTLSQVTDPDLGTVRDVVWIAGYFMTTDGTSLVVTELLDPGAVNPLKYGSADADPDEIMAVDELRNEAYALGRHSIEAFQNVGGDFFPFRRIEGAQVPKGIIGTHAYCHFGGTFAFVGSGRNEAPAVYLMGAGTAAKMSTREIDTILAGYTEAELSAVVMESRVDKGHNHALIHLPDRCLVYDGNASQEISEPVWFTLDSGVMSPSTYRARGMVWAYDKWLAGDPTSSAIGELTDAVSSHYGAVVGWEFGTLVLYADGNGAIVHELELVALPGRAAFGADPVVWTSYSVDGQTWSLERSVAAGKQGDRAKRIAWRQQGSFKHYRMQRFRGNSDAHLSMSRLELQIEPLFTRPRNG